MGNNKFYFRNNSDNEWADYYVGGASYLTIKAKDVIAVGPKTAEVLRKNLCDRLSDEQIASGVKASWLEEVKEKDLTEDDKKRLRKDVEEVSTKEVKKIEEYEKKRENKKKK